MTARGHHNDYDRAATLRCERALVTVEFLCETAAVAPGDIFRPKEGTGSKLAAFNVRGAMLARDDYIEVEIERERLDSGGQSRVALRVANVLPYVTLKVFAFQDRHENKDAYDLIYTLLHTPGGPHQAGVRAASSPVCHDPRVADALRLLQERFADIEQDGPTAYANFLAEPGDDEQHARFRQEAVATRREFLTGLAYTPR